MPIPPPTTAGAAPAVATPHDAAAPSPAADRAAARVPAVDLVRGLIMVLMLLDHTRDYVHASAGFDATDPARTTVALFATRWITHLCAPAFVFLAGVGIYLQGLRGKPRGALARFLVSRGLWLIVLELTVIHLLLSFRLDKSFLGMASVFWMIGASMIVLAALIWLPTWAIGAIGVALIVGHNGLDRFAVAPWAPGAPLPSAGAWVWTALHQLGFLPIGHGGRFVFIGYPLIPWIGVMAAGYAFGAVYRLPAARRPRLIAGLGAALVVAFVVGRAANGYGEPIAWEHGATATVTVLSFLRLSKYPPSLLFLCATLGIDLLLLAWFERRQRATAPTTAPATAIERVLLVFGRVPLFFYVLQWLVTHAGAVIAVALAGQDWHRLLYHPITAPPAPPGAGVALPWVYLMWLAGLALLYLPCRWFAGVKARHRAWWLSYL